MQTLEINILQLAIGLLLILIPAAILYFYGSNLVGRLFVSTARMVAQLSMVGLYLKYLFEWNNIYINLLWLSAMAVICTLDMMRSVGLNRRRYFGSVIQSLSIAIIMVLGYFLGCVLMLDNIFESRYFIPIAGILMGNILSSNIVGLNSLMDSIKREQMFYNYQICNGATPEEATRPFIRQALVKALQPTIASTAVMGLVALPGTLVGQILGGSSPDVAIRYQIMVMVIVMACNSISLLLILKLVLNRSIDKFGNLTH